MMYGNRQYEYMGYEYRTYEDIEEDNIKTFHLCFKDGKRVILPREFESYSPYRWVPLDMCKGLIDAQVLIDFARV
jgi:hypothetical protein